MRIEVSGDQLFYDTFVQPEEPVTDYLTQFSGITKDTDNRAVGPKQHVHLKP